MRFVTKPSTLSDNGDPLTVFAVMEDGSCCVATRPKRPAEEGEDDDEKNEADEDSEDKDDVERTLPVGGATGRRDVSGRHGGGQRQTTPGMP